MMICCSQMLQITIFYQKISELRSQLECSRIWAFNKTLICHFFLLKIIFLFKLILLFACYDFHSNFIFHFIPLICFLYFCFFSSFSQKKINLKLNNCQL